MSKIKSIPTKQDLARKRAAEAQRQLTRKISWTLQYRISRNASVKRYKGGLLITELLPPIPKYYVMKITYISHDGRIKTEIKAFNPHAVYTLKQGRFSAPILFRSAVKMVRRIIGQSTSDTFKKE